MSERYKIADREKIESLLKKGLSYRKIADQCGLSRNGVYTEIKKNGGIKNYCASSAQEMADIKLDIRICELKKTNIQRNESYMRRVENLEFQVEILHETIKEILNGKN